MPLMSDRRSVAANTSVANVFSGNQYEYLLQAARIRFGIVAAAVGVNATISTGQTVLQNDQEVSGANRYPTEPDDFTLQDIVGPGERIVVGLRNTTGGAIVVVSVAKIDYLG